MSYEMWLDFLGVFSESAEGSIIVVMFPDIGALEIGRLRQRTQKNQQHNVLSTRNYWCVEWLNMYGGECDVSTLRSLGAKYRFLGGMSFEAVEEYERATLHYTSC